MKNKKLFILALFFGLLYSNVYAKDACSKEGYTILTINGIFTNEEEAVENKDKLKDLFYRPYNNQKVSVNYIYNPTHLAGAGDLVDSIRQGLFDPKSDYDLVEMLDDASDKVGTQKLLIVGHSQGNFYANSFYNKVVDKDGGVPSQSIGVYGVATPDKYVAGNGKYLTSDTDSVIAAIVGRLKNIMKPNTHIELQKIDGNGHSFSDVYLKYRSDRIVSDIKSSFDKLKINNVQDVQSLCISPQEITKLHKVTGVVLAVADFSIGTSVAAKSYLSDAISNSAKSLAGSFVKLAKSSLALVGLAGNKKEVIASAEESVPEPIEQPKEEIIINNPKIEEVPVVPEVVIIPEELKPVPDAPVVSVEEENNNSRGGSSNKNPVIVDGAIPVVDTIPPVITLNGESILTSNINTPYIDAGATCLDNIDGIIAVVSIGDVDVTKIGSYVITYSVTDKAGNTSLPVTRTVNIVDVPVADTTAPVITLNGENIVSIELNGLYEERGATALDNKDGVVDVTYSGVVDTSNLGDYTITYTAIDLDSNVGTINRLVKVVNSNPVPSATSKIEFPSSGVYRLDGLELNLGRKDLTKFIFNVIYTDSNNKPPQSIKMHVKDTTTGLYLPDIDLVKGVDGLDILNDGNYVNGELYELKTTFDAGYYLYFFTAHDSNGNYSKIIENNLRKFNVYPSTYVYIPKYTFGTENGDGNNWQIWSFNGSNIYDWSDVYVDKYLREQFKMQIYPMKTYCSNCLKRGIFNHDPKIGFEPTDVILSSLENSPQNKQNGITYDVVIQWDPLGYTYYIFHGNVLDFSGHTDIPNMNNDLWVSWTGSYNDFTIFPSGSWQGSNVPFSPDGRTGGSNMMMTPYPVYNTEAPNSVPSPVPSPVAPDPAPILSSEKLITSFKFENLSPLVEGVIDSSAYTINLKAPYGTDVKSLTPTILISDKASISPESLLPQDFTNPIVYTVKAEDNTTQTYTVNLLIEVNPNPTTPPSSNDSDDTPAVIKSYTLNGNQNSITLNPKTNNLTIVVNTNKNVEWKSIQIEKEDDEKVYKTLPSNETTCVHGTNRCERTWDGDLVRDLVLQNVNYKIVVHFVDTLLNNDDYNEYLPSVITVIGQPLD